MIDISHFTNIGYGLANVRTKRGVYCMQLGGAISDSLTTVLLQHSHDFLSSRASSNTRNCAVGAGVR
jgi:hypothetical protein